MVLPCMRCGTVQACVLAPGCVRTLERGLGWHNDIGALDEVWIALDIVWICLGVFGVAVVAVVTVLLRGGATRDLHGVLPTTHMSEFNKNKCIHLVYNHVTHVDTQLYEI